MAFLRRLQIFVLLDTQFIRRMWAHSFDHKTLLNGNISYKHFGNRLKSMNKELSISSYNESDYVEKPASLKTKCFVS